MRGLKVIIAGAGMSAALPGVAAAHTDLPVIGVPILGKSLGGLDALLSAVQMPPGVPVACVAIDGAKNAGVLAARIINASDRSRGTPARRWARSGPPQRKMECWLEVELAATDAWAEEGVVPAEAAEACRERAPPSRSRRSTSASGSPTTTSPPSSTSSPRSVGEHGRWIHYGLTSSDVLDTALALQLRAGRRGRCSPAPAPTATRWSSGRSSTATRSASAAPTASTPSRRPSACASPASPSRPTATSRRLERRLRAARRRQALRRGRHLRLGAARGRGAGDGAARPAARGRRHPGRPARPPRGADLADRDRRRRPRALRDRGPQPAAHRGARGRGAVRRRPEGLLGDAPQAQPDPHRADHRPRPRPARLRPGRARERRPLARARHLPLRRRAGDPPRRDDPASTTCRTSRRGSPRG